MQTTAPTAHTNPTTTDTSAATPVSASAAPTVAEVVGTTPGPSGGGVAPATGRSWPLWGGAAGALGVVATLLSDTRPPESDLPIGKEDVFALSPTGFHVGIVAGLAATFCLLVTAAAWRRWANERAPGNLAAGMVPPALTASAGAMIVAYGMKGSLAVYLPGGMDEGSYTSEGLYSVFLFLDFAPYLAWWGVTFAAMAMAWLALRDRLLPRWLGVVSIPFVLAPLAFVVGTGLPGFTAIDSIWLAVASAGLAVSLRRRP